MVNILDTLNSIFMVLGGQWEVQVGLASISCGMRACSEQTQESSATYKDLAADTRMVPQKTICLKIVP